MSLELPTFVETLVVAGTLLDTDTSAFVIPNVKPAVPGLVASEVEEVPNVKPDLPASLFADPPNVNAGLADPKLKLGPLVEFASIFTLSAADTDTPDVIPGVTSEGLVVGTTISKTVVFTLNTAGGGPVNRLLFT